MSTRRKSPYCGNRYPLEVRLSIVKSYLCGGVSYHHLAFEHGVSPFTVGRWVRQYGPAALRSSSKSVSDMARKKPVSQKDLSLEHEVRLLRQQLKEKEKEVKSLQLKAHALDMMIDIAESSFDIDIRKKSGTKQ